MADRIIRCAHDGNAHPATALFCSQCKRKLSLVRPSEDFLNHRFTVLKADHETEASLCWLVLDRLAGGNRILREIFPAMDAAPGGKQRFDSLCTALREAAADVFPRALLHFSREGRCYVVEEVPEGTPLEEALSLNAFGEEQATGYFWSLVEALAGLESARPPLYHGALRTSTIRLRASGQPLLLTDPACLEHTVTRDHPMISEAAAQQDLRDAADLAVRMLNGGHSEGIPAVLAEICDDAFASVLEWALLPERNRPCSARDLLRVRDLVTSAERAKDEGRVEAAVARYDEALTLCHASRLQNIVGEIRARQRKSPPPPPPVMLRCHSCGLAYPPGHKFCGKCGNSLQASEPPLPQTAKPRVCLACRRVYSAPGGGICPECLTTHVDPPPEPLKPPPPTGKSDHEDEESTEQPSITATPPGAAAWSTVLIVLALLVAIVVAALIAVGTGGDGKFDGAIARGALVTPAGDNAYEIYLAAQKESRSLESMEKKALPVLRSRTEAQLRKHRDGDLVEVEWLELQKIYEWLGGISGKDEDRAGIAYATGRLELQKSDFRAAYDSFQRALRLRPGWSYALNSLGRTSVRLSNMDAAIEFYKQAVDADPLWVVPRLNLGAAYVRQRRFDEAEAVYADALRLDGSRPATHFLLAQLYDAQGGDARRHACRKYRDALRFNQGQAGNFDVAWTERRVNGFCVSAGY